MKLALLLFGVVLLASLAYGRPVGCEDEPEDPPLAVDALHVDIVVMQEPNSSKGLLQNPKNIIDAPKVCPDGQKLDHQGKCRPVMG
uniref:Uncharacterized protein n=1 Tax=Anopheles stephensi TaxID=30069 RepID=A0A182Y0D0_ANOST